MMDAGYFQEISGWSPKEQPPKLRATLTGWDNAFWNLKDWYREA